MKIHRIISIIMLLLQTEKVTAQYLSEAFDVSLRTIYRDIEAINSSGIPIVSSTGKRGGISIIKQYKVEKRLFTDTDIAMLLTGLEGIFSILQDSEIINAIEKIKSLVPKERSESVSLQSNKIVIDLKPWKDNKTLLRHFSMLKTAIGSHEQLNIEYIDRKGIFSNRTIDTYTLILKDNHWYTKCFCHEKKDFRLFKLLRILSIKKTGKVFERRSEPTFFTSFCDKIFHKLTTIQLLVDASIIDQIAEYCGWENMTKISQTHYSVNFLFSNDDYGYNLLFSFGSKCECVGPLHIRKEIKRRLSIIMDKYS